MIGAFMVLVVPAVLGLLLCVIIGMAIAAAESAKAITQKFHTPLVDMKPDDPWEDTSPVPLEEIIRRQKENRE